MNVTVAMALKLPEEREEETFYVFLLRLLQIQLFSESHHLSTPNSPSEMATLECTNFIYFDDDECFLSLFIMLTDVKSTLTRTRIRQPFNRRIVPAKRHPLRPKHG